jgi:hypothetical protein
MTFIIVDAYAIHLLLRLINLGLLELSLPKESTRFGIAIAIMTLKNKKSSTFIFLFRK